MLDTPTTHDSHFRNVSLFQGWRKEGFLYQNVNQAGHTVYNIHEIMVVCVCVCVCVCLQDCVDAFEKLLRLGLKDRQEREIVHVLVDCCLQVCRALLWTPPLAFSLLPLSLSLSPFHFLLCILSFFWCQLLPLSFFCVCVCVCVSLRKDSSIHTMHFSVRNSVNAVEHIRYIHVCYIIILQLDTMILLGFADVTLGITSEWTYSVHFYKLTCRCSATVCVLLGVLLYI